MKPHVRHPRFLQYARDNEQLVEQSSWYFAFTNSFNFNQIRCYIF
jgi:hypothetical protein